MNQYLNSMYQEHNSIFDFMRTYKHRENKGYNYSNQKRAQDHVARVILGTANKEEPYKLSHTSSSRLQRKIRKRYRRTIIKRYSQNPQPSYPPRIRTLTEDPRRTVVAYGDASIRGTYKGHSSIPVKAVQRAIATKAVVISVDEFRTSVTCCRCFGRLENTPDERLSCIHKKKLHRSNGQDGHPNEKKKHEENHVLYKTSECPERVRPRQRRDIYPLKLCVQCQGGNNASPLHWNSDVNAAANIRQILTRYVEQGFNLDSRPEQLSRGRRDNEED
ncbi:hypothetical protein MFLAVUS_003246 [Mucor flavus]|uniref:Uncharacterized protein n=1 Tax=Mucor flavus TaxID=439312 RepID=A0ABP9YSJ0_9FUNG